MSRETRPGAKRRAHVKVKSRHARVIGNDWIEKQVIVHKGPVPVDTSLLKPCERCQRLAAPDAPLCPACGYAIREAHEKRAAERIRERQSLIVAWLYTVAGFILGLVGLNIGEPGIFPASVERTLFLFKIASACLIAGVPWLRHWWLYWRR